MNHIEIRPINLGYRNAIISLLQAEGLPIEDLPVSLPNFYMALDNGHVVGAIGLEIYEHYGLLRSLVVKREYRKMKIAAELVKEVERLAKHLKLAEVYLLTETAQEYFSKNGYSSINRTDAPAALQQSSEFSHACPSSAIAMKKIF